MSPYQLCPHSVFSSIPLTGLEKEVLVTHSLESIKKEIKSYIWLPFLFSYILKLELDPLLLCFICKQVRLEQKCQSPKAGSPISNGLA